MSDQAEIRGIFINDSHQITVAFGTVAAHIGIAPDEMRSFAAALLVHADEMERETAEVTDAAFAKARSH